VILPAAAPTILTGMRISMGIAWLVIVAAEMLVGGTGIGYFVWNEWNNLSLTNVIFAILLIGVVGMLLDLLFAQAKGGDLCGVTPACAKNPPACWQLPAHSPPPREKDPAMSGYLKIEGLARPMCPKPVFADVSFTSTAASSSASSATRVAARPPS
jgi:hypothetical protein